MPNKKRILICPLDWGLGHATRCVPVIRELIKQGAEPIIAADGRSFDLLQQEFPELESIHFPGYDINYPKSSSGMAAKMALSIPRILSRIKKEEKELEKLIEQHQIDAVISDNRYGLGTSKVPSVFIIHQLMVKSPFGENLLHKITSNYISKYQFCWIPDFEGEKSLSGDLANKFPQPDNAQFVGALSRFQPPKEKVEKQYDLLALISGPEPQRTVFEEMILEQLKRLDGDFCLVAGKPAKAPLGPPEGGKNSVPSSSGEVDHYNHLGTEELQQKILSADLILSRPGYSTIMDLAALGKKAIFVPTPGQTEQEYLAQFYLEKKQHFSMLQKNFDLKVALEKVDPFFGFQDFEQSDLLEVAVGEFLETTKAQRH